MEDGGWLTGGAAGPPAGAVARCPSRAAARILATHAESPSSTLQFTRTDTVIKLIRHMQCIQSICSRGGSGGSGGGGGHALSGYDRPHYTLHMWGPLRRPFPTQRWRLRWWSSRPCSLLVGVVVVVPCQDTNIQTPLLV